MSSSPKRTPTSALKRRATRQRAAVLRAMRSKGGHLRAQSIYDEARKGLNGLSLGTVYRLLGLLVEEQVLDVVQVDGPGKLYELRQQEHDHAVCQGCGLVVDVPATHRVELSKAAERASGFHIESGRVEYTGRCAECFRGDEEL